MSVEDPLRQPMFRGPALLALLTACGGGLVNTSSGKDTASNDGIPNVYIDIDSVDFGSVEQLRIAGESVQVQNTGTSTLEITAIEFSDTAFFASAGAGLQIPPGTSTTLALKFQPQDYVAHSGSVTISTNDPDEPNSVITLRGDVITDFDDDGHDIIDAGGDDCDDDNPEIYPGAPDRWYDGIDSDCLGNDDYDQDGDGHQTDGRTSGTDCQDANPDINPDATDVWYDGVDSDCDGSDDYDKDGDGWRAQAYGAGSDCDDENAEINPDGAEVMNGFDDNCDGEADNKVPGNSADVVISGAASGDRAGWALTAGDLDEDGLDDLIIGSAEYQAGRGAISIFDGADISVADGMTIEDGQNYFNGDGGADRLGQEAAFLSNTTTDEGPHLAVGSPYANGYYGAVHVLSGTDAFFGGDTGDAAITVQGGSGAYFVGMGLAQDLDLDGDGIEELLGYYQTSSSTTSGTPYLWLLYGDTLGNYTVSSVDARFTTSGAAGRTMQANMPLGGDLDGDGYLDGVYCDHLVDVDEQNDGATWALFGSSARMSGDASLNSAGTMITSGDQYERQGYLCAVGDDMDGDGDNELWVMNPGKLGLYVLEGGTGMRVGNLDVEEDAMTTYTWRDSDPLPTSIRSIGDWSGDGVAEIAVGVGAGSSGAGEVWVFSSEDGEGEFSSSDAWATAEGQNDADEGTYQVAYGKTIGDRAADYDGDGKYDFVVSDYLWGDSASSTANTGRVYLSFGQY